MDEINIGAELFAVGFFAIGGVALGAAALCCRSQWSLGLAALFVGAATAAGVVQQPAGYWLPPLALGAGFLLLAATRHFRSVIATLIGARRVHALFFLAAGPIVAAAWVYRVDHLNDTPGPDLSEIVNMNRPADPDPADYIALTDQGTTLRLYHRNPDPADVEIEQKFEANLHAGMALKVIQTAGADPAYNCHGWVFAGGRFHLRGQDVETILADNGYAEVSAPRPGDVIVYRNSLGTVLHSGVVRLVDGDQIIVESKWGTFGRYLHGSADQWYSGQWAYYHSPQDNRTLRIEGDALATSTGD